jgi:hypothetical protein
MDRQSLSRRVLRHTPYFLYVTLASVVSIACIVAFFQYLLESTDQASALSVLGGMLSPISEASAHGVAQLNTWLNVHESVITLGGIIFGVIGFALFTKTHTMSGNPAWFGAPTGLFSLALLWEVHPAVMPLVAQGIFVLVALIGGIESFRLSRYRCPGAHSAPTYFGEFVPNWMMVVGFVLLIPLTPIFGRWEDLLPPKQGEPAQAL